MADLGPDRVVAQFGRYTVTAMRNGRLAGFYLVERVGYAAIFKSESEALTVAFQRSISEKE